MRVTVIVPCFDVAPYVDDCLRSVIAQTYRELEVIVVDDGSTDETGSIIERRLAGDDRCQLIRQPNRGLGAARNAGLDRAAGDAIAFVDGDDFLAPDAVERLVRCTASTDSELVVGAIHVWDEGATWRATQQRAIYDDDRRGCALATDPDLVYDSMACGKLFQRAFWDRLGLRFRESVRFEDADVVMRAYAGAKGIDVVATPVYFWRRRTDGSTSITQMIDPVSFVDRFAALRLAHQAAAASGEPAVVAEHVRKLIAVDLRAAIRRAAPGGPDLMTVVVESAQPLIEVIDGDQLQSVAPVMQLVCRQIIEHDVEGLLMTERTFGAEDRSVPGRAAASLRLIAARPHALPHLARALRR